MTASTAAAAGSSSPPAAPIATAAAAAARGNTGGAVMGDFNTFLTLLTTQLRNQSPTDPMDTNRMTQELVQFASVEQQTRMNEQLEQLVSLQQAAQLTAAAPLIGRAVEVESDRLALQDGQAALRLPPATGSAAEARVMITDPFGRILREQRVPLAAGSRTTWLWDGRDAQGRPLPDGAYRVQVEGAAPAGAAPVPLGFTVLGTATAAERQDGTLRLLLGRLAVGFDQVRGVGDRLF